MGLKVGGNNNKPYVSSSQLEKYRRCPKQWWYQYVRGYKDVVGEEAKVGGFVHEVLERICQLPPEDRTLLKARELATNVWKTFGASKEYVSLKHNSDDTRRFKRAALDKINGLWDVENPKHVDVVATEHKIETTINDVPFLGIIDRLDKTEEGLVVTDYKSGKAPKKSYERERLEQVLLYSLAVQAERGILPTKARLLYLGQRIVETNVTKQKADLCGKRLTATWEDMKKAKQTNEYPAKAHVLCGWCSFLNQCETGQKFVQKREQERRL